MVEIDDEKNNDFVPMKIIIEVDEMQNTDIVIFIN
jgi:hypothetical protein